MASSGVVLVPLLCLVAWWFQEEGCVVAGYACQRLLKGDGIAGGSVFK